MASFWIDAKKLEGATLTTSKRGSHFEVVQVNEDGLTIRTSGGEFPYRRAHYDYE
jgi:hypothetical protein